MMMWSISIVSLFIVSGACIFLYSCKNQNAKKKEWNRGDFQKRTEELDKKFHKNEQNKNLRLQYAQNLFEVGEFKKSEELLQPLLSIANPPADAIYTAAHIEYLHGRYGQAERMFATIANGSSISVKIKASVGLVGCYYQTNRYSEARTLFKGIESTIKLALWEMMKGFGDEQPYQIDWNGRDRSVIPFTVTDPLPVIPVTINGKQINVFLDTGGELFYLDESIATTLGIKAITRQIETGYAGGKSAEVGYGRVDSLIIGDVTLRSVPIKLGPIQQFSTFFNDNLKISGVLTTGVLQQFLVTLDYPEGQLILRPRNEAGQRVLKNELLNYHTTELAFVLGLTHILTCRGTINGSPLLNFFLDSGLASSEASLLLPKQTLDYLGIPIPPTELIPENKGGLGGGGFQVGRFTIDCLNVGLLRHSNIVGLFGVFPPQLYQGCEFIIDGIVSHQFLKKYKWTIDFDSMKILFTE